MASSITLYNNVAKRIVDQTSLLDPTNTFKATLHTSSYTASAAHSVYADLTNELSTGFGYTNGGLTLTSAAVDLVTTNDAKFYFSNNAVWTASGGDIPAWRTCVIRAVGTLNLLVDPLICYIVGNTTGPTDIPATTSGNTLTLTWNASGLVTFTY